MDAWALGLGLVLCKAFELMWNLKAVVLAWPVLKMTLHSPPSPPILSLNPHNDKKQAKQKQMQKIERDVCDAINCFEAAHKAYCFNLEWIHRGEYKLNLVNFHLWASNISCFFYRLEDLNIKMCLKGLFTQVILQILSLSSIIGWPRVYLTGAKWFWSM